MTVHQKRYWKTSTLIFNVEPTLLYSTWKVSCRFATRDRTSIPNMVASSSCKPVHRFVRCRVGTLNFLNHVCCAQKEGNRESWHRRQYQACHLVQLATRYSNTLCGLSDLLMCVCQMSDLLMWSRTVDFYVNAVPSGCGSEEQQRM